MLNDVQSPRPIASPRVLTFICLILLGAALGFFVYRGNAAPGGLIQISDSGPTSLKQSAELGHATLDSTIQMGSIQQIPVKFQIEKQLDETNYFDKQIQARVSPTGLSKLKAESAEQDQRLAEFVLRLVDADSLTSHFYEDDEGPIVDVSLPDQVRNRVLKELRARFQNQLDGPIYDDKPIRFWFALQDPAAIDWLVKNIQNDRFSPNLWNRVRYASRDPFYLEWLSRQDKLEAALVGFIDLNKSSQLSKNDLAVLDACSRLRLKSLAPKLRKQLENDQELFADNLKTDKAKIERVGSLLMHYCHVEPDMFALKRLRRYYRTYLDGAEYAKEYPELVAIINKSLRALINQKINAETASIAVELAWKWNNLQLFSQYAGKEHQDLIAQLIEKEVVRLKGGQASSDSIVDYPFLFPATGLESVPDQGRLLRKLELFDTSVAKRLLIDLLPVEDWYTPRLVEFIFKGTKDPQLIEALNNAKEANDGRYEFRYSQALLSVDIEQAEFVRSEMLKSPYLSLAQRANNKDIKRAKDLAPWLVANNVPIREYKIQSIDLFKSGCFTWQEEAVSESFRKLEVLLNGTSAGLPTNCLRNPFDLNFDDMVLNLRALCFRCDFIDAVAIKRIADKKYRLEFSADDHIYQIGFTQFGEHLWASSSLHGELLDVLNSILEHRGSRQRFAMPNDYAPFAILLEIEMMQELKREFGLSLWNWE